jgi:hypothetical protein
MLFFVIHPGTLTISFEFQSAGGVSTTAFRFLTLSSILPAWIRCVQKKYAMPSSSLWLRTSAAGT